MNDCSAATASLDDLDALIDVGGCFSFRSVTKRPVAWQQGARGRKRERDQMQSASKRENSRGGEEEEKGVASLFVKKAKVRLNQQ